MYLQTLFVPALTLSQWHSLAYEGNAVGSPVLFPVLCVACQPNESVQSLAFQGERDWNFICFQVECLGHGFVLDFMSGLEYPL